MPVGKQRRQGRSALRPEVLGRGHWYIDLLPRVRCIDLLPKRLVVAHRHIEALRLTTGVRCIDLLPRVRCIDLLPRGLVVAHRHIEALRPTTGVRYIDLLPRVRCIDLLPRGLVVAHRHIEARRPTTGRGPIESESIAGRQDREESLRVWHWEWRDLRGRKRHGRWLREWDDSRIGHRHDRRRGRLVGSGEAVASAATSVASTAVASVASSVAAVVVATAVPCSAVVSAAAPVLTARGTRGVRRALL